MYRGIKNLSFQNKIIKKYFNISKTDIIKNEYSNFVELFSLNYVFFLLKIKLINYYKKKKTIWFRLYSLIRF
jgi:hypothetical protein